LERLKRPFKKLVFQKKIFFRENVRFFCSVQKECCSGRVSLPLPLGELMEQTKREKSFLKGKNRF